MYEHIFKIQFFLLVRKQPEEVRKMYQLDANNFIMISSHKWPLHVSDIYMSIFRTSYMLFHCRMWCYAIGVEAVVLRSWCVVWCTVCQLV